MELTKEYFDEKLAGLVTKEDLTTAIAPFATKDDLKGFATKDDLVAAVAPLATKSHLDDSVDGLARIIATSIAEPLQKLIRESEKQPSTKQEIQELKHDVLKIKTALHLNV